jgi:hypothetical protein
MTSTESDLAYQRRAMTRIYRLAQRDDLELPDILRQIAEQASEALERPETDGEAIDQLKKMISEYKSQALDAIVLARERAILQTRVDVADRSRRELEARLKATALTPDQAARFARFQELGCVLARPQGDIEDWLTSPAVIALAALARRVARELEPDEMQRRGQLALTELLEAQS